MCVLVTLMYMFPYVVKDCRGGHVQVGTTALLPRLEGVGLWAGKGMFAVLCTRRKVGQCVGGEGNVCGVVSEEKVGLCVG